MAINLTSSQVTELANPFTKMLDSISEFYKNPKNEKDFQEWHLKKFGCEPDDKTK